MTELRATRTASGRRSYPVEYRIEFMRRWDESVEHGSKTRLLREHGVAPSTAHEWLAARERGDFTRGALERAERKPRRMDSRDRAELARLRSENEALRSKVEQAEAAQEILGKAFVLLEGITKGTTTQDQIPPGLMNSSEYAQWLKEHKLF